MSDLRQCPFCGDEKDLYTASGYVRCLNCECEGPYVEELDDDQESDDDAARDKWNTRAADAQVDKLVGLLREAAIVLLSKNAGHQVGMSCQIDAVLAAYDASKEPK